VHHIFVKMEIFCQVINLAKKYTSVFCLLPIHKRFGRSYFRKMKNLKDIVQNWIQFPIINLQIPRRRDKVLLILGSVPLSWRMMKICQRPHHFCTNKNKLKIKIRVNKDKGKLIIFNWMIEIVW
jgi:hypothetical protein